MTEVDPEEKDINHRKFHIFNKNYKCYRSGYGWSIDPVSCVTVTQFSKGRQWILQLTNRYKGQWSPCPVQGVDTKNYVVTLGLI